MGLERLTIVQLRDLANRQMAERRKSEQSVKDWDAAVRETLDEFMKRVDAGETIAAEKGQSDGKA